ncbi:MAG: tetratricopeptide repeat protein [Vampirovibrionales bacterium]|nr:tetratricopeptide repeat protein [Vampirovibrionales bacterium]
MSRGSARRSSAGQFFRLFASDPRFQYVSVVIFALLFAALVFSGFLLFRLSDQEDLLNRGKRFLAQEKVAWAANEFQKLVNRYPDSYDGHLYLGQAYLELDQPQKAEQEFRLAAAVQAKGKSEGDIGVTIALAKLDIARKHFAEAENKLLATIQEKLPPAEVKAALFDLYTAWGDALSARESQGVPQDQLSEAVSCYQKALVYVSSYDAEQEVKQKLADVIEQRVGVMLSALPAELFQTQASAVKRLRLLTSEHQKTAKEAINLLKTSLSSQYDSKTLIEIARLYEVLGETEEAIIWFRKAFDVSPARVGLTLSNLLVSRSEQLKALGQNEAAEQMFEQAKDIERLAKIPLHALYPVKVSDVSLLWDDVDPDAGVLTPTLRGALENVGDRQIPLLRLKASFSSNGKPLGEVILPLITTKDKPLPSFKESYSPRVFKMALETPVSFRMLSENSIQAKLWVAYQEGEDTEWFMKSLKEGKIPNRLLAPEQDDTISGSQEGSVHQGREPVMDRDPLVNH